MKEGRRVVVERDGFVMQVAQRWDGFTVVVGGAAVFLWFGVRQRIHLSSRDSWPGRETLTSGFS